MIISVYLFEFHCMIVTLYCVSVTRTDVSIVRETTIICLLTYYLRE